MRPRAKLRSAAPLVPTGALLAAAVVVGCSGRDTSTVEHPTAAAQADTTALPSALGGSALWSVSFESGSAAAAGNVHALTSVAPQLTLARASAATVQTSAASVDTTPGENDARIGSNGTAQGLVVEEARTNYFLNSRSPGSVCASSHVDRGILCSVPVGYIEAQPGTTITAGYAPGPDGSPTGSRVRIAPNQVSSLAGFLHGSSDAPIAPGDLLVYSEWLRASADATAGSIVQWGVCDNAYHSRWALPAVTTQWTRSVLTPLARDANGQSLAVAAAFQDWGFCGDVGVGVPMKAPVDQVVDLIQAEKGAFATEPIVTGAGPATRAGDHLQIVDGAGAVANGQLTLYLKMFPKGNATAYSAPAYLFYADQNDFALFDPSTQTVTLSVGGTRASSAPPPPAADGGAAASLFAAQQPVEWFIRAGAGAGLVQCRIAGGNALTLVNAPLAIPLSVGGAIDLLSAGTSNQFSSWLADVAVYPNGTGDLRDLGSAALPPTLGPLDQFTESARVTDTRLGASVTLNRNGAPWTTQSVTDLTLDWVHTPVTNDFDNISDASHKIFQGNFLGDTRREVLFNNSGDGNWWLGAPGAGTFGWTNVWNASFGDLNDGKHVSLVGRFTGGTQDEVLFYNAGDNNWWLGAATGAASAPGSFPFVNVGNNEFGNLNDSRIVLHVGDFTGAGRSQVLLYDGSGGNWTLCSIRDSLTTLGPQSLVCPTVGNNQFGSLNDGQHTVWFRDFSGSGRDEVYFYSGADGDGNWWHGSVNAAGTQLTFASTKNWVGNLEDGKHSTWQGNFTGTKQEIVLYSPDQGNFFIAQVNGDATVLTKVSESSFGNLHDGHHWVGSGNFSGSGRAEILFNYFDNGQWIHGALTGPLDALTSSSLQFNTASTAGFNNLADGKHVVVTGDFTNSGKTEVLMYYSADSAWWRGSFSGSTLKWVLDGDTRGFNDLLDGNHTLLFDAWSGVGRDEILMYYPTLGDTYLGAFEAARLALPSHLVPGDTVTASQSYAGGEQSHPGPVQTVANNIDTIYYDNARTGWNPYETVLTPANVLNSAAGFGPRVTFSTSMISSSPDSKGREGGTIYAQPLYVHGVKIDGASHDVLYAATAADQVLAFDGDATGATAMPLASRFLFDPAKEQWADGLAAYGAAERPNCANIYPTLGIIGTPVIDVPSNTMFVVTRTQDLQTGTFHTRLHAIDLSSLLDRPESPFELRPGDSTFAEIENQRSGLLLSKGIVYVTFASQCDGGPWQGWVFAFDTATLNERFEWSTGNGAGIWAAGAGPAADVDGNVFLTTGNCPPDKPCDWDSAVLRFSLGSASPSSAFFDPDRASINAPHDWDLGSGAVTLLPGGALVAGGKQGYLHVVGQASAAGDTATPSTLSAHQRAPIYWNPNGLPDGGTSETGNGGPLLAYTNAQGAGSSGSDSNEPGLFGAAAYYVGAAGPAVLVHGGQVNDDTHDIHLGGELVRLLYDSSVGRIAADSQTSGQYGPSSTTDVSSDASKAGTSLAWFVRREKSASSGVALDLVVANPDALGAAKGERYFVDFGMWSSGTGNGYGTAYTEPMIIDGKVFVGYSGGIASFSLGAN